MIPWQLRVGLFIALSAGFVGCKPKAAGTESSPASSASASAKYIPPSQGVGTVEGTVFIEGDPALVIDADAQKIPLDCDIARTLYPPLFREGPGRTLADAFVGVTGYKGQAAPKSEPLQIEAKGCAFPSRTYALTTDQHLRVKSGDGRTYVPGLYGAKNKATLVAVPNGNAVPVFHRGPGQYVLVNEMQIFAQATTLVVDYSTFAVTGIDGKFRILGVPAGDSEVSVYLPAAKLNATQKIRVSRGRTTPVTFRLKFDASAFKAARAPKNPTAASGAASATTAIDAGAL